ncbi:MULTISPECIES: BolA family protein [Thiorhodovibrio]|uniref:BolA family protein n=1 Tax=Thiorhodovibrio TaxID=61593 RepID=UPI001914613B|nr:MULTISPECIES: BolA family protein [Thiorhodovibrio]MBK5967514.1 BolA family transcriptional regulator [Thiorhodovibrio winogradskyi]WPL13574.1 transcriptional regulator BolA [Thiorhodovibrio litoralis]
MPRKERIEEILSQQTAPEHLAVIDESHMHAVPAGAESHFKLVVVSEAFAGESLIKRHRRINGLLREEFDQGLHALAIHAFTPAEWRERGQDAPASPKCRGGSKAKVATATQAEAEAPA